MSHAADEIAQWSSQLEFRTYPGADGWSFRKEDLAMSVRVLCAPPRNLKLEA